LFGQSKQFCERQLAVVSNQPIKFAIRVVAIHGRFAKEFWPHKERFFYTAQNGAAEFEYGTVYQSQPELPIMQVVPMAGAAKTCWANGIFESSD